LSACYAEELCATEHNTRDDIDPRGVVIAASSPDLEELIHADVSEELVQSVRRRMQSLYHRRQDLYG